MAGCGAALSLGRGSSAGLCGAARTLQRKRFRYRLVASSRFLVRIGIRGPHLANHALRLAASRLDRDWLDHFGHQPTTVESFVRSPREAPAAAQPAARLPTPFPPRSDVQVPPHREGTPQRAEHQPRASQGLNQSRHEAGGR